MNLLLLYSLIVAKNSWDQIWTGTDKIVIDKNTEIVMPNKLKPECYNKEHTEPCYPETSLTLIYKGKSYNHSKPIEPWQGSFFIYFVKIKGNSYVADLDHDGFKEIAIYPAVCGNSPKSMAYIYTVKKHELLPYGTGVYYWEIDKPIEKIKTDPKFKPDI